MNNFLDMVRKAKNIYDYYRGSERDEGERKLALENNTTKALINTLENCSPSLTQDIFEKEIGTNLEKDIHYYLQKKPERLAGILEKEGIDIEKIEEIYILGISRHGERDISQGDSSESNSTGNSRPDAFIFDDQTLIAIEVKTGHDELKELQLDSHKYGCNEYLNVGNKPLKVEYLEWNEIWEFLNTKETSSRLESFLINQLMEYLEVNRMTPFRNFDEKMLKSEGRPKPLKEQLFDLTERLRKELEKNGYELLSHNSYYDGRSLDTWDYLSYDKVKEDRDIPHLTFSLLPREFHIKLHIQGKPGKDKHIDYLWNLSDEELDSFKSHLMDIYRGYSVDNIENKDKLPNWYNDEKDSPKGCVRPIWLTLKGARGGAPQGESGTLRSKDRIVRELGIIYESDFEEVEKFMRNEFRKDLDYKFRFQVVLLYPFTDTKYTDSLNILTGKVGRNFYEEAKEAVDNIYPLFEDIVNKSL